MERLAIGATHRLVMNCAVLDPAERLTCMLDLNILCYLLSPDFAVLVYSEDHDVPANIDNLALHSPTVPIYRIYQRTNPRRLLRLCLLSEVLCVVSCVVCMPGSQKASIRGIAGVSQAHSVLSHVQNLTYESLSAAEHQVDCLEPHAVHSTLLNETRCLLDSWW